MIYFLNRFNEEIDVSVYENDLLGKATSSLNIIQGGEATNVVPDSCIAEIDIRTVPELDHEALLDQINTLAETVATEIENFEFELEILADLLPVTTDFEDDFVQIVATVTQEVTGNEITAKGLTAYTDAARFVKAAKSFSVVIEGPGNTSQSHQTNEWVEVDLYLEAITIYQEIASRFLSA